MLGSDLVDIIIMNFLTNILDTTFMGYFLLKVLNRTIHDKKRWIISLIGLIIFNTFINFNFGLGNSLGFILMFTVSTVVYSYLLDIKYSKILMYSILGIILVFISELIVISSIAMVFKVNPSIILELNIYRIIAIISAKFLFYLISRVIIRETRPINMKNFNINQFILIGSFNIIIMIMTLNFSVYVEMESRFANLQLMVMGLGSILFSWLIYKITQKMIYQSQQEIIWKMREEEFQKRDFYLENMNDILHTIKSQDHDLNNYLSTLYGLIYLERFEEAKKYIVKINDRISSINNIVETNHPVITSLVSMKKKKALEENIDIELNIDLPEGLPLDYVDLSIIIGNLLDNAIEACQLVKEDINRKIELSIYIDKDYLIIETINTKDESIKLDTKNILKRFTTKSEDDNHGFGLGNIEFIVEQYNGTMNVEDLGNKFSLYISLLIEETNRDVNLVSYST